MCGVVFTLNTAYVVTKLLHCYQTCKLSLPERLDVKRAINVLAVVSLAYLPYPLHALYLLDQKTPVSVVVGRLKSGVTI
ncbi:hypothetical protein C0Q70_06272 [Pomacea canaliculata]|uniref:Uncharacterized protein n=1 Tax=Pomacea canaliculata TaxID=400727 RepID=A0A2T7PNJ2_POMCA|nr:hypothetical protein C0Q70_06272 [Pomacea canaliculata]